MAELTKLKFRVQLIVIKCRLQYKQAALVQCLVLFALLDICLWSSVGML